MRKWTLDLSTVIPDMLETWDEWRGLLFKSHPFQYAEIDWDFDRIEEKYGVKLFFPYKEAIRQESRLYGEGNMPSITGTMYLAKAQLEPFLSDNRLVIEVYETGKGMDGDIVVAVNGVVVATSNKRLLVEKTIKEVRHEAKTH